MALNSNRKPNPKRSTVLNNPNKKADNTNNFLQISGTVKFIAGIYLALFILFIFIGLGFFSLVSLTFLFFVLSFYFTYTYIFTNKIKTKDFAMIISSLGVFLFSLIALLSQQPLVYTGGTDNCPIELTLLVDENNYDFNIPPLIATNYSDKIVIIGARFESKTPGLTCTNIKSCIRGEEPKMVRGQDDNSQVLAPELSLDLNVNEFSFTREYWWNLPTIPFIHNLKGSMTCGCIIDSNLNIAKCNGILFSP